MVSWYSSHQETEYWQIYITTDCTQCTCEHHCTEHITCKLKGWDKYYACLNKSFCILTFNPEISLSVPSLKLNFKNLLHQNIHTIKPFCLNTTPAASALAEVEIPS